MTNNLNDLVQQLRKAHGIVADQGNVAGADTIADICDSISLGDLSAIDDYKQNVGGMGGIAEYGNGTDYDSVIEEIGQILNDMDESGL